MAGATRDESGSRRRAWFWAGMVAATIFFASSNSRVAAPEVPSVDKYAHFLVYGLLGTLVCRALGAKRGAAWLALALTSAFGVTDEVHQYFVPGRSSDVFDWVMDTAGAGLAIGLYTQWAWYRGWLESRLGRNRRIENPAPAANLPAT